MSERTRRIELAALTGYIASGMLVIATLPAPYGYYTLLRLVVCSASALLSFAEWEAHRAWPAAVFALTCLLFNPLMPVYLQRSQWLPIDIITAVAFAVAAYTLPRAEAAP